MTDQKQREMEGQLRLALSAFEEHWNHLQKGQELQRNGEVVPLDKLECAVRGPAEKLVKVVKQIHAAGLPISIADDDRRLITQAQRVLDKAG